MGRIYHSGLRFQSGRGVYTPYQSGAGLGAIFGALGKFLLPLFRRGGSAALKSGIRFAKSDVGKDVIKKATTSLTKTGSNLASNVILGKNPKKDLSRDLKRAADKVVSAVQNPKKKKKPVKKKKAIGRRRNQSPW